MKRETQLALVQGTYYDQSAEYPTASCATFSVHHNCNSDPISDLTHLLNTQTLQLQNHLSHKATTILPQRSNNLISHNRNKGSNEHI